MRISHPGKRLPRLLGVMCVILIIECGLALVLSFRIDTDAAARSMTRMTRVGRRGRTSTLPRAHQPTMEAEATLLHTFNSDIARVTFPSLFFSLHHRGGKSQIPRHHLLRPSPFEDPASAQTAERMLRRMLQNRQRSDGRTVCPDRRTFGLVAGAYGRLRYVNRRSKDFRMVTWYGEESKTHNSRSGEHRAKWTPTDKLVQLLQLQLELCAREGWPRGILPQVGAYNRILKRLARGRQPLRGVQALELIKLMQSRIPVGENGVLCKPDSASFEFAIEAIASFRKPVKMNEKTILPHSFASDLGFEFPAGSSEMNCIGEAEVLLEQLESMANSTENHYFNACRHLIEGLGRHVVTEAKHSTQAARECFVHRSVELLVRLEALAQALPPSCIVPSSTFTSVILALSTIKRSSSAQQAEEILLRMLNYYRDLDSFDCNGLLSSQSFNTRDLSKAFSGAIAAHSSARDTVGAERVMNKMCEVYESGAFGGSFVPDVRSFGSVIALYGKKHSYRSNADHCERILSRLEDVALAEKHRGRAYHLTAQPYNIAMLARVRSVGTSWPRRQSSTEEKRAHAEANNQIILRAQSLLDHMEYSMNVKPDPYTYSILLNAWCKQSRPGNEGPADEAEMLLRRRIEDIDIEKVYGDAEAHDLPEGNVEIWPNAKHYASVLKAHAQRRSAAGAKKAVALLSEMEQRHFDATIIADDNALRTKSGYVVETKDVAKPDLVCYAITIDAFANSRLPEASVVALRLLEAVETKFSNGDESMKPNARLYTAAILSLVHSPYIEEVGEDENFHNRRPQNNAKRAWGVLERMKESDVKPNSFSYNYVINCCASQQNRDAQDKKEAFSIAVKAFQELRAATALEPDDSCIIDPYHPDSFTYAFMLKCCNNLLGEGNLHMKVASQTFKACCSAGYLNDAVLDRLWNGVSPDQFFDLVDVGAERVSIERHSRECPVRVSELPSAWSRCCNSVTRRSKNRRMQSGRT